MLYELKIKLTSAWLGEIRRGTDKVRRFQRGSSDDLLAFDLPRLQWTLQQACDALHLRHVDTSAIRFNEGFKSPTLQSYRRRYKSKGSAQEDFFEAIPKGTILTIPLLITDKNPENSTAKKPPTRAEMESILKLLGGMLGMSPWGNQYGYGRFSLESLEMM